MLKKRLQVVVAVSLGVLFMPSLTGCNGGSPNPNPVGCGEPSWQPGGPWGWCPDSSAYQGDSWSWTLEVTSGAAYCETFDEARTLEEEYLRQALLRVVPGSYPVPSANGQYPFRLPLCLQFREPDTQPLLAGPGTIGSSHSTYNGELFYHFNIEQPLLTGSGEIWFLCARLDGIMPPGQTSIPLNGDYPDPMTQFGVNLSIFRDSCANYSDPRGFSSCHFNGVHEGRHLLTFDGGSLELHLRIGMSMASTEPALFTCASGELDSVLFGQQDYWKLIYNPTHHHFSRDFIVLLDQPIGGACGLKAEQLDPYQEPPLGRLTTVRCDLSEIEERTIRQESWEWLQ